MPSLDNPELISLLEKSPIVVVLIVFIFVLRWYMYEVHPKKFELETKHAENLGRLTHEVSEFRNIIKNDNHLNREQQRLIISKLDAFEKSIRRCEGGKHV